MNISSADLRRLLEADAADAELVMSRGRKEALSGAGLVASRSRGALPVVSRSDLLKLIRDQGLTEHDLSDVAGRLNTAISIAEDSSA